MNDGHETALFVTGRNKHAVEDMTRPLAHRNKEYFVNNYLEKKIEQTEAQSPEKTARSIPAPSPGKVSPFTLPTSSLVLPSEVIIKEYGVRNLIIIHYLIRQILVQICGRSSGFQ